MKRLGRKTRLSDAQRQSLWSVFDAVRTALNVDGLTSMAGVFTRLAAKFAHRPHPPFEHIVVDEAQDISVAQLRFLAAVAGDRPNGLFFAGDLGQRIFQLPFSWKSLGVDVRGRARTLYVNYRTSHQIRSCADRLLGDSVADVDGLVEVRKGTVSVFNGPKPEVHECKSLDVEIGAVAEWLKGRLEAGLEPHEIGVIVRSETELPRAEAALQQAGIPFVSLDERMQSVVGKTSACTMHLAKGLEFRAVAVMACDDEVVPLQPKFRSSAPLLGASAPRTRRQINTLHFESGPICGSPVVSRHGLWSSSKMDLGVIASLHVYKTDSLRGTDLPADRRIVPR